MNTGEIEWFRVRLELKRIQTWLFLVPKLKTIVGANTLLGEFVRIRCATLAVEHGACAPDNHAIAGAPSEDPHDPLTGNDWQADAPDKSYAKGILARDGGHFQALFKDGEFGGALAGIVSSDLPGISFEVHVDRWDGNAAPHWREIDSHAGAVTTLLQPPSLPTCQLSGDGLATKTLRLPERSDPVGVSKRVKQQWEAGDRFAMANRGKATGASDIVSLLQAANELPLGQLPAPADLKEITEDSDRYVALIHADGNNVGNRSAWARGADLSAPVLFETWLAAEAKGEKFFHGMRVAVRKALVKALGETFKPEAFDSAKPRPYQVLMLGGDDLLLLCRASHALRFSLEYARALGKEPLPDKDNKPLGAGIGIAICPPSLPFHRMHDLAKELADSAKRIARRENAPPEESVIDWMVVSQSAALSVAEHRRRFDSLRYREPGGGDEVQLALTAKPYPVLASTASDWSLERLLAVADALTRQAGQSETTAARSQMKALPALLRRGYHAGSFAARDLPEPLISDLTKNLAAEFPNREKDPFPWRNCGKKGDVKRYRTLLADLFEIIEIPNLGRGRAAAAAQDARAPASDELGAPGEAGT